MSGTPFAPDGAGEAEFGKVEGDTRIPWATRADATPPAGFECPTFWGRGSFYRELTVQLIFGVAYILLDRASIAIRLSTGAPAWYLPAGLSLAILLCGGMRYLPIVIVSGVTVAALSHHPILSLAGIPRNIVVSVCYAGGAVWLRRVWRLDLGLRRLPDVGGLALFLVAVKFPAALFSILTFLADGLVSRRDFWKATFNWWVGDSISITSLTPFLLLFVSPWVGDFLQGRKSGESSGGDSRGALAPSEALERTAELASVLAALWLVFGFKPAVPYQPLYLLFFPVIWMAVRGGLSRASLAVLAINLGVIVAAHTAHPDPEGLPRRQLVMLALALTGLSVGAVVSERREAEAALQQKSEELDSFFNVSLDLLCIATTNGYFLRLNPAWESTLGYSRDELKAQRFFDFVHSDEVEATRKATVALASQQKVVGFTNRYRRKDGEYRWLEWRAAPAGNLIYAAARDVTERRSAENTLRRRERELKDAQRLAQVGSWEWDISSNTTHWSDELYRISDRDPELPPPTNEELQQLYSGENWERLNAAMQNALGTGTPYNVELERTQPDGTRKWIMAHGEAVRDASRHVVGLRGTAQDITERKQAEEELRRSREELQRVLASIPDYLWSAEIDSQGHSTYRYHSPVVEKITGRPPAFYLPGPERWLSTIHPDDRPRVQTAFAAVTTGQVPRLTEEYRIIRPDGTVRWVRDSVQGRRQDGRIRVDGVVSDVTERKTAELDLLDREERFRKVFEEGPLGMSIVGPDGTLLRANATLCAMYGYTEEELRRLKVPDFTHPEDVARYRELTGQLLRGEIPSFRLEKRVIRTDGEVIWTDLAASVVRAADGTPIYGLSMVQDITERKRTEQALKDSEQRYRDFIQHSTEGLWRLELEQGIPVSLATDEVAKRVFQYGYLAECNDAHAHSLGFSAAEDAVGKRAGELLSVADEERVAADHTSTCPALQNRTVEIQRHDKAGNIKHCLRTEIPIVQNGNLVRIWGLTRDITELRQAEEALRESEARLRLVVSQLPAIVWSTDKQLRYTSHMGAGLRALGVEPNQMVGQSVHEFVSSFGPQPHRPDNRPALAGQSLSYEVAIQGRDYDVHVEPLRNPAGEITGTVGIALDVTARKRAEAALRESQALTNAIVDSTSDMIWSVDPQGFGLLTFNRGLRDYYLHRRGIRLHPGMRQEDLFADRNYLDQWRELYQRALSEGSYTTDYMVSEGSIVLQLTFNLLQRDGSVFGISVFGKDITKRRQAEEALRESEERFRTTFENAGVGMALVDPQGHPMKSNPALQKMLGYSGAELAGMSFIEFTHADDRELDWDLYSELVAGKRDRYEIEKRYITKGGQVMWGLLVVSLVKGADGAPQYAIGMVQDITERKRAEEDLRASEARFRTLITDAPVAIGVARNGITVHVNTEYIRLFGLQNPEDTVGRPILDQFAPQYHAQIKDILSRRQQGLPAPTEYEAIGRRKDGSTFPMQVAVSRVDLADGPVSLGFLTDLTERKRAEEALRQSDQRYKDFISHSNEGVWRIELAPSVPIDLPEEEVLEAMMRYGTIAECNLAFARILGFSTQEELVGKNVRDLLFPSDEERLESFRESIRGGMRGRTVEFRGRDRAGNLKHFLRTEIPIIENGMLVRVWGLSRDVSELKRAEEERQRSLEQLRALAARLQSIREEERQKVAREIHDQLGQALTAIKIDLSSLVRELPAELEQPPKKTSSIFKLVDETIQSVRRISTELRPGILDDLGLVATIEWAGEEFESRTGTKCRLTLPREDISIDPDSATAIFRIFQETLTNVARHAEASEVDVRMAHEGGDLILEVHDNGKGFPEGRLSDGKSLGILGMRERAVLLGGELAIDGAPGRGTTVSVRVPQITPVKTEVGS